MKPIKTLKEAEQAVNDLLKLETKVAAAQAKANKKIADVNDAFLKEIVDARESISNIRAALETFAKANRSASFFGDKKSIALAAGTIGFRDGAPSIDTQEGVTDEDVVKFAFRLGFASVVRPGTPSLDKTAAKRLNDDELRAIGLVRNTADESFYCNLNTVTDNK